MTSSPGRPASPHETAVDVVIRWQDHGHYGSRDRAVDALRRRTDLPAAEAARLVDLVARAHAAAVKAVPAHERRRPFKLHPFATSKDIDHEACRADMRAAVPELPEWVHDAILGWVVYWHWMR